LYGVDQQIKKIEENTKNFLEGLAFNHGLLWGVRGSGKSSIIRGILKNYAHKYDKFETLEINSEDLSDLPKPKKIKINDQLEKDTETEDNQLFISELVPFEAREKLLSKFNVWKFSIKNLYKRLLD